MAERDSPHYLPIALTPSIVDTLLESHYDASTLAAFEACTAIEPIARGWNNLALKIRLGPNRPYVLRLSKSTWPREKIVNEICALRLLDGGTETLGIRTPVVKAFHLAEKQNGDEPFHWILTDFLQGENLEDLWRTLDASSKHAILDEIASIIAKLQERTFQKIGGWTTDTSTSQPNKRPEIGTYFEGQWGPFDSEAEFYLGRAQANLDNTVWTTTPQLAPLRSHLSLFLPQLSTLITKLPPLPIVLFHGDFAFRNFLCFKPTTSPTTTHPAKLSALLDWEWSGTMPLAQDWLANELLEEQTEDDKRENKWIRRELIKRGCHVYEAVQGWEERRAVEALVDGIAAWRIQGLLEEGHDEDRNERVVVDTVRKLIENVERFI